MEVKTYPEFSVNYPLLLTTFMKRPVSMYPDDVGLVYRNPDTAEYFRFTWRQWYKRTCRLANALRGPLEVKPGKPKEPGDRIATMALNHHYHMELYYGVPCSGAVLHPINVRLSLEHIIHTINHSEDKIIFFDDIFLPMLENIYGQIKDTVEKFVYISDKPGLPKTKIKPLYEYEKLIMDQPPDYEWPHLHEDNYATLCYTTGTTGLPKGVMFTHRQLYLLTLHSAQLVNLPPCFIFTPGERLSEVFSRQTRSCCQAGLQLKASLSWLKKKKSPAPGWSPRSWPCLWKATPWRNTI